MLCTPNRPICTPQHTSSTTPQFPTPEVSRSPRAAPTSHKWTRTVCGAVRRPCLVRDSAYARGPRSGWGRRNKTSGGPRAGAEERQRRERVVARRGPRSGGAARARRHSSPPSRTLARAHAHGTQHVATGAWLSVHAAPARVPPPLSMRERGGGGNGWCWCAWWRRDPGTHGHGRQATAGAEQRSRPMPTLGPGPTRLERAVRGCRLTCRAVPSSRLAVPLGVF